MIHLIWARSSNFIIGVDNNLPWKLVDDMKYFQSTTLHKVVVMGKKTFASLRFKPLVNRPNIILSKELPQGIGFNQDKDDFMVTKNINHILEISQKCKKEVFIIGGLSVYNTFLPYADYIHETVVDVNIEGVDESRITRSPIFDDSKWDIVDYHRYGKEEGRNDYNSEIKVYKRAKLTEVTLDESLN